MNVKIAILFLLISVSLVGWGIYAYQRLTMPETTMAEINRAFPADSYQIFLKAEKLTLYALKPERQTETAENFHGFQVVGKTEIDTVQHQRELKGAFIREMASAKSADCFNPRHGLRAIGENGKTIDLAISFECGKFVVYSDGANGEGAVKAENLEAPFNQILQNAGIEAAK
ncbi:MAG: hypothetical protein M3209_13705 [Acidobacteriota bacterium]|nr:hypothetical protein [Acidobacteriota bacterium]